MRFSAQRPCHSGSMRVGRAFLVLSAVTVVGACSSSRATTQPVTASVVDPKLLLTIDDFPAGFNQDTVDRRPKLDHCGVGAEVADAPSVVPAAVGFSRSANGPDLAQFVFTFASSADADQYVAARRAAVSACTLADKTKGPVEVRPLTKDFGEGARFAFQLRRTSTTESGDSLQDQVVLQRGRIVEIIINQSPRVIDTNRTFYTVESALRRLHSVPAS
jgi:hypothetical protein